MWRLKLVRENAPGFIWRPDFGASRYEAAERIVEREYWRLENSSQCYKELEFYARAETANSLRFYRGEISEFTLNCRVEFNDWGDSVTSNVYEPGDGHTLRRRERTHNIPTYGVHRGAARLESIQWTSILASVALCRTELIGRAQMPPKGTATTSSRC
jgi:hypothetical protein